MSRSRLLWLEAQLEREDLTDLQFDSYNKEANAIQDTLNAAKHNRQLALEEERRAAIAAEAMEKALSLTDSEVDEMYSNFHILNAGQLDANGRTFAQWFEQAVSLYEIKAIEGVLSVTSKAKSENEIVWSPFVSAAHARSKILELIKIKFRDHHNRTDREGCDFAHIPQ